MYAAFASISAYGWNHVGSWLRRTRSISRENVPSVPSAASTRSEKSRVGSFLVVSIWPISEPVQKMISPNWPWFRPAASRRRRSSQP